MPISLGEVAEVVKKLLSGRAPGVNDIRHKMMKVFDIVGLSWLTHFFSLARVRSVRSVNFRIVSLLFADDVVLLASLCSSDSTRVVWS